MTKPKYNGVCPVCSKPVVVEKGGLTPLHTCIQLSGMPGKCSGVGQKAKKGARKVA